MEQAMPTPQFFEAVLSSLGIKASVDRSEEKYPLCRYFVKLDPQTRLSKLEGMGEDIALAMKPVAPPVIRPDFASGSVIVEMMFSEHPIIRFEDLIDRQDLSGTDKSLPILLGTTDITTPLFVDLAKLPHLIVAGTTGSGKSMLLHSITSSLLRASDSVGVKLALIDPKLVEFDRYLNSKALLYPVVNDAEMAVDLLQDLKEEMNNRYAVFQKYKCRDISEYRARVKKISYIVLVIDELADLIRVKGFEKLLCELAQKSRAAGIHIIAATQHPSSKVLTGEIRANFPSKVACKVTTQVHSRVVLDRGGAENLLGKGDALLLDESGAFYRFRGAYVSPPVSGKATQPTGARSKKTAGFFGRLLGTISKNQKNN
jgi:S-DNA-T family DNA segregation ATPase FtsK/SpoIIIE